MVHGKDLLLQEGKLDLTMEKQPAAKQTVLPGDQEFWI